MPTIRPEGKDALIDSVDKLFRDWKRLFKNRSELPISKRAYLLDDRGLAPGAGILQIKDYANESNDQVLRADLAETHKRLKIAKSAFFELVTETAGLNYFGLSRQVISLPAKKNVASVKLPNESITTAIA